MVGVFGLHLLVVIALLVAHFPHYKSAPYEFSYEILELNFFPSDYVCALLVECLRPILYRFLKQLN